MLFDSEWPYLGPGVKNYKNKGTFFSPTFKVGEKKVPSLFWFYASWPRYDHTDSESIFSKVTFMSVEQKNQLHFLKKIAIFYFF